MALNALLSQAWEAFDQGQLEEADALYCSCLAQIDDRNMPEYKSALHGLGYVKSHRGAFDEARGIYRTLHDLARSEGNTRDEHVAMHQLGMVERMAGEVEAAIAWFQAEFALLSRVFPEDAMAFSVNLYEQGHLLLLTGDHEQAAAVMGRSLTLAREAEDPMCQACSMRGLGEIALARGDRELAATCFQQSAELFANAGDARGAEEVRGLQRRI